MDPTKLLVAVLALAFLVEWLVERFFGKWVKGDAMVYLSAVAGIGFCLIFQLDGLSLLGLPDPLFSPWTGQILTGLIVGAGSSAVHKFFGPKEATGS